MHPEFSRIVFTEEAKCYTSGRVSRTTVFLNSESRRKPLEHELDGPKLNVWCALTHETVNGPFSLQGGIITYKQFISEHVGNLCSSAAGKQPYSSCSCCQ
jgi:hypothetical protein